MTDFVKYHALGNDYLIIDPNHVDLSPTPESMRLLCDRHFGIGADGVLFGPDRVPNAEPGRAIGVRIFNSDGSECEKSGNGLRMFALYLAETYRVGDTFNIRTAAGESPVEVLDRDRGVVKVAMGLPSFDASHIPVLGVSGPAVAWELMVDDQHLTVTSVNVGNPHTVVPLEVISRQLASTLGPQIARHPRFPRGTNVQLLRVVDRHHIELEIWERGAGYTLASGSSSCAAASAARALGLVDECVTVTMPGGELEVSFDAAGSITMTGAAEQVASGSFAPAFGERLGVQQSVRTTGPQHYRPVRAYALHGPEYVFHERPSNAEGEN